MKTSSGRASVTHAVRKDNFPGMYENERDEPIPGVRGSG